MRLRRPFLVPDSLFCHSVILFLLVACTLPAPRPDAATHPVFLVRPWIDAHVHADFFNLAEDQPLALRYGGVETFSPEAFAAAMRGAGVGAVVAMAYQPEDNEIAAEIEDEEEEGQGQGEDLDPVDFGSSRDVYRGVEYLLTIREQVPGLFIVLGVKPQDRPSRRTLARVERWAAERAIVGFKLYLGYDHHYGTDEVYEPYLRIAETYGLPVVVHTGDTDSSTALLKFAHPLTIDELAVRWRKVKFVMAHLGNPWTLDAAEVLFKNPNVYADLSGLLVCDAAWFADPDKAEAIREVQGRVREAFDYAGDPTRFLFGSDWPLAPLGAYARFIADAIPPEHHQAVFRDNAIQLFGLLAPASGEGGGLSPAANGGRRSGGGS